MTSKLTQKLNGKRPIAVYFCSWSSGWASNAAALDLANIPNTINLVYLAFANPVCNYVAGSMSFSGTGIDFSSDFPVVKGAIQLLQQRGVVVMLSVGGATYSFNGYNATNIAALVNDLGCDGADCDFEPANGNQSANQLGTIINNFRQALGPNKLLSIAGFSVGAFTTQPPQSIYTGLCIPGLKSNGYQLDFISIMAYDCNLNGVYSTNDAFDCYRQLFSGPILIGLELGQQAWSGHLLTLAELQDDLNHLMEDPQNNGIMIWSLQKDNTGTPSLNDCINQAIQTFSQSPNNNPTPIPQPNPVPNPTPVPNPPPQPTPIIQQWNNTSHYKIGDKVIYNNTTYTCQVPNANLKPDYLIWNPVSNNTPTPPVPSPSGNAWQVGIAYTAGTIVTYNNHTYKCLQSHTSLSSWTPDVVPALWLQL